MLSFKVLSQAILLRHAYTLLTYEAYKHTTFILNKQYFSSVAHDFPSLFSPLRFFVLTDSHGFG
jgi:hypothetical protein